MSNRCFYTYMVASRTRVLYVGVTGDLRRRVWEHRQGTASLFTARYRCKCLVWYEAHADVQAALTREKVLKGRLRVRKIALIEEQNRTWKDLSADWYALEKAGFSA